MSNRHALAPLLPLRVKPAAHGHPRLGNHTMAELGSLFKKKKKKSFKSKNLNALNKPALAATIRTSIGGRHGLKVLGKKPTIRADAPKPVNLTSLRKEHNGLDIHVKLVGEGGWASEDSKHGKAPPESHHGVAGPGGGSGPGASGGSGASSAAAIAARQRWERSQQNPRGLTGNWGDDALIEDQQFPGLAGRDNGSSGDRSNNDSGNRDGRSAGPARAFRASRYGPQDGGAGPRPRFPDRDRFPGGPGGGYRRDGRPSRGGHSGRNDRGGYGGDRGGYGNGYGGDRGGGGYNDYGRGDSGGIGYNRDSGGGYSRGNGGGGGGGRRRRRRRV